MKVCNVIVVLLMQNQKVRQNASNQEEGRNTLTTNFDTADSFVMFREQAASEVHPFFNSLEIVEPPVFPI